MLDFKQELYNLLKQETQPLPKDELTEIAMTGQQLLATLNKKQSELSLQVEEIYDIVGNTDTTALQEVIQSEKRRADTLAGAMVGLCDILEDVRAYARNSGDAELDRQTRIMWKNAGNLLERCGFARLGEDGQPLDPEIHAVRSVAASPVPREHVAQVLQSGYRYLGSVIRKAAVVLSEGVFSEGALTEGALTEGMETKANEQNHWY
jgi:molecular chaperone GrpE (heat shock protein)